MSAGFYILTLVLHDQSHSIASFISDYETHLEQNKLHNIPFHMKDLLHGHGDYEGIEQSVLWSQGRFQAQLFQAGTKKGYVA